MKLEAAEGDPGFAGTGGTIVTNESVWKELYGRRIFFTVRRDPSILFGRSADAASSGKILASRGITVQKAAGLAARIDPAWFPDGAVLDIEFLHGLSTERGAGGEAGESFRTLAEISRIRLQGTDGLRGKTRNVDVDYREALRLFLSEGIVSPAFLGLSAKALGMECLENGLIGAGEDVVVGADGRDSSGRFAKAVGRAFAELGFRVLDAGVLATPGIPLFAYYVKSKIGAIVTASHNPSNQNGIKFVYDGFKLANDGPAGEYGLTAYMYWLADRDLSPDPEGMALDVHAEATELLYRVDLENAGLEPRHLEGVKIVYDGANGAYSAVATKLLAALGADFVAVNVEPRGHNINQNGGVGEIEGHAYFEDRLAPGLSSGSPSGSSGLASIQAMFGEGRRAAGQGLVFGIVNDGDGDRGYLLVYSSRDDRVYVVPGDEIAFWLARGRRDRDSLGVDPVCVNSVESDILAGHYMKSILGIESATACVGDKHLLEPAKEGKNHIVGCEESGHVTFGVRLEDREGKPGTVYTGNGLLSVLRAITVIRDCGSGLEEIIHPFPPGAKDSRYVYFVDKSRFYRDSYVWREDERIALDLIRSQKPAAYSVRRVDFPDDPQMLYLACFNPGGLKEAALFVRNSGTEMKSCVTIRCSRTLYPMMREAMVAVHRRNRDLMKDIASRDAIVEKGILDALCRRDLRREELKTEVERLIGETVADTDFDAILFAMRKEGLLTGSGDIIGWIDE